MIIPAIAVDAKTAGTTTAALNILKFMCPPFANWWFRSARWTIPSSAGTMSTANERGEDVNRNFLLNRTGVGSTRSSSHPTVGSAACCSHGAVRRWNADGSLRAEVLHAHEAAAVCWPSRSGPPGTSLPHDENRASLRVPISSAVELGMHAVMLKSLRGN